MKTQLMIAAALVSGLAVGQVQAMEAERMSTKDQYEAYARVVLGEGIRHTGTSDRMSAPDAFTYRAVVGGERRDRDAHKGTGYTGLGGYPAYQRAVGG